MLELLQHEPIHVGRPPRLLARIMSPEPKHERGDLLAVAFEVFSRCLTGAREISHPSCRSSGTQTAVSSPARDSLASPTASRRFVFTRSPGFFGMSEGAATMQSWPSFQSTDGARIPSAPPRSKTSVDGIWPQVW